MHRFEVGAESFWIYATTKMGAIDLATTHIADGVDARAHVLLVDVSDASVVREAVAAK